MDGATLQRRRREAKLGQAALAKAVGVSRSTVSHWETDRALPDAGELRRIERALGGKAETRRSTSLRGGRGVHEIDLTSIAKAPSNGGVAALFDAGGKPLWVGKARNLRRKLKRLSREAWFGKAARASVIVVHRRRMREKIAELARRLIGLPI